ncbi:hypothetical protein Sjap_021688 [Stephania japonica]|uniref:Uncharacterized protein n=1 Tax=Stephania japonica TaxID=461633 RepID=A0AAP0EMX5_9MAGN
MMTWDLHGSRPGVSNCTEKLGPSHRLLCNDPAQPIPAPMLPWTTDSMWAHPTGTGSMGATPQAPLVTGRVVPSPTLSVSPHTVFHLLDSNLELTWVLRDKIPGFTSRVSLSWFSTKALDLIKTPQLSVPEREFESREAKDRVGGHGWGKACCASVVILPGKSLRPLSIYLEACVPIMLRYCCDIARGELSSSFHLPERSKGKNPAYETFCEDLRLDSSTLA